MYSGLLSLRRGMCVCKNVEIIMSRGDTQIGYQYQLFARNPCSRVRINARVISQKIVSANESVNCRYPLHFKHEAVRMRRV